MPWILGVYILFTILCLGLDLILKSCFPLADVCCMQPGTVAQTYQSPLLLITLLHKCCLPFAKLVIKTFQSDGLLPLPGAIGQHSCIALYNVYATPLTKFVGSLLQPTYGFIQCCDRDLRIFFHYSQINEDPEDLNIGGKDIYVLFASHNNVVQSYLNF